MLMFRKCLRASENCSCDYSEYGKFYKCLLIGNNLMLIAISKLRRGIPNPIEMFYVSLKITLNHYLRSNKETMFNYLELLLEI